MHRQDLLSLTVTTVLEDSSTSDVDLLIYPRLQTSMAAQTQSTKGIWKPVKKVQLTEGIVSETKYHQLTAIARCERARPGGSSAGHEAGQVMNGVTWRLLLLVRSC